MQRNYGTQHHNFRKNTKVQVMRDGQWVDYTIPCTQKLAVEIALKAEKSFGLHNVRLANA
jgi:hypothetical protein